MSARNRLARLCAVLSVALCGSLVLAPATAAQAAGVTVDEPSNPTSIALSEGEYYDITKDGAYSFSGEVAATTDDGVANAAIRVHSGVTATIVLDNATIVNSSSESLDGADNADAIVAKGGNGSPLYIGPGATVNLYLKGENTLVGWQRHYNDVASTEVPDVGGAFSGGAAGIYLPEGALLIVGGTGSLTVSGGNGNNCYNGSGGGAGIGTNGSYDYSSDKTMPETSGTLVVAGGTVKAQGGAPSSTDGFSGGAGAGVGGGGGGAIGTADGAAGSNGAAVVLAGALSASTAGGDDVRYESCLADPVGSGGSGRILLSDGTYLEGARGSVGTVSVANDASLTVAGGTEPALQQGTTTVPNPPGDEVPGSSFITIDAIGIYSSSSASFERLILEPTEAGWQVCDDSAPTTGATYAYVLYNAQDATYWGGAAAYSFVSVEGSTPVNTGPFTVYGNGLVFGFGSEADYWFENGVLTIKTEKPVTISMPGNITTLGDAIVVDPGEGRTANVVISNVWIDLSEGFRADGAAAFELRSGSLDLTLSGSNHLISPAGRAGLENGLNPLTISGSGSLEAVGGKGGAGIGGRQGASGGSNVTILGGAITATGGANAAGIGGGEPTYGSSVAGSGSHIKIGGTARVTATGGSYGPGIGNPVSGSTSATDGGDLSIFGDASVEARGAVGIGNQFLFYSGISISENATVRAYGRANEGNWPAGISGKDIEISGGTVHAEAGGTYDLAIRGEGTRSISGGRISAKGSLSGFQITGGSFRDAEATSGSFGQGGRVYGVSVEFMNSRTGESNCLVQTGDEDYPYEVRCAAKDYSPSLAPSSPVTISYRGSAPDSDELLDGACYFMLQNGWSGGNTYLPAESSDLSFTYVDQGDQDGTVQEGLPTEVGTYTVTASLASKIDDDGMYYFGGSGTPFTLTIEPAATTADLALLDASGDEADTFTYGETITMRAQVSANGSSVGEGTATFGYIAGDGSFSELTQPVTATQQPDGSYVFEATYDTTSKTVSLGSQTLQVRFDGGDGYVDAQTDATATLSPATLSASVSAVDPKIYDGTTEATGVQISLATPVGTDAPTATGSASWTSAAAGTATLNVADITLGDSWGDWYELTDDGLAGVTPGNAASIGHASLTVAPITPTDLVFGDAAPASYAVDAKGWVGSEGDDLSDDLAGALSFSTSYAGGAHAGGYEVTVGWADAAPAALSNYDVSFSPATLAVGKASVASVAVEFTSTKYTGEPVVEPKVTAVDANGHASDGVATLTWLDETGFELPGAPTEVGSYTLRVGVAEGTDHLGASRDIPFTVARADASTVTVGTVDGKTYDGDPVPTPSYERGGYDGEVTLTWQVSDGQGGWSDLAAGEEPVDAGVYRLVVTAGQSATQEAPVIVNGEQVVVIAPAEQDAPEGLGATDEGGPAAGDGSLTGLPVGSEWRLAGGEWAAAPEGGIVAGLAPGTYEVRFAADANHLASESVLLTVRSFSAAHGGIEFPKGSSDDGSGMVALPEDGGTVTFPGGPSVTLPGGSVVDPDTGGASTPDGIVVTPGGDGSLTVTFPGGATATVPGGSSVGDGVVTLPDGTTVGPRQDGGLVVTVPDGTVIEAPSGSSVSDGRVFDADGDEVLPPSDEPPAQGGTGDSSTSGSELAQTGEPLSPAWPLALAGVIALLGWRAVRWCRAS